MVNDEKDTPREISFDKIPSKSLEGLGKQTIKLLRERAQLAKTIDGLYRRATEIDRTLVCLLEIDRGRPRELDMVVYLKKENYAPLCVLQYQMGVYYSEDKYSAAMKVLAAGYRSAGERHQVEQYQAERKREEGKEQRRAHRARKREENRTAWRAGQAERTRLRLVDGGKK